jgi:signal transduction histidine kinase/DNA-binding response OmpR family regulator
MVSLLVLAIWLLVRWRTFRLRQRQIALEAIVKERTQQIALQAESLRELDSLKSRFFANISHELRTPLTLIMGPLQRLEKSILDGSNKHLVQLARQHSRQLIGLINELLDLSKLEANRMEVNMENANLSHLAMRAVANFESAASQKNIDIHCHVDPAINRLLSLDLKKVEKILNNLLSNAVKFTPAQGEVNLSVVQRHQHLIFAVSDTGRGIAEKDLPKVFDRFYQSKREDAETLGGSGIGLALSKELAELMEGDLWVESKEHQGTTFFFKIPLIDGTEAPEDLPAQESQEIEALEALPVAPSDLQAKILLVEDNVHLRNFLSLILADSYHLITATHGKEALQQLQSEKIDLIISDVMMPVMDGFELLEAVKADSRLQQIPVIMLTARAELKDKLKALRIGVDDYLIKPFDEEELKARVANLLQHYVNRNQGEEEQEKTDVPALGEADREWLAEVEDLVLKQIKSSNLNLSMLVDDLAISHRQFNRRLKRLTGLNASGYIREVRLHHARELLLRGTYRTIAEVSYAVGFDTPKYFSRLFFQRFGKRPSEMAN